jgi:hypothetical protein
VTQPPGHGSQVDPTGQELGRDVVAQIVRTQIVETDPMAHHPERSAGRVRPPRTATIGVVAEHEGVGGQGDAALGSDLLYSVLSRRQGVQCDGVEGNSTGLA